VFLDFPLAPRLMLHQPMDRVVAPTSTDSPFYRTSTGRVEAG